MLSTARHRALFLQLFLALLCLAAAESLWAAVVPPAQGKAARTVSSPAKKTLQKPWDIKKHANDSQPMSKEDEILVKFRPGSAEQARGNIHRSLGTTQIYLGNLVEARALLDAGPLAPAVMDAMVPYLTVKFGNASSIHSAGREAKKALEKARETIMHALGAANPECICFTGSGSEADNMAIQGVARALRHKGNHVVTSAVEHPAVLGPCRFLEEKGFQVTYVKPDESGLILPEAVAAALRDDTILISIMHANNETGTINPIPAIGTIARERNILFHTDAVQSFCKAPFTVDELGADLLSVSAHKINGPKGVGALYIREGVPIRPLIYGGHQEAGLRAGTENIAGIVGTAKAAELGQAGMEDAAVRMKSLRDKLERGLLEKIPHARLNGHPALRLPNTLNLSFPFVESESLLLELDLKARLGERFKKLLLFLVASTRGVRENRSTFARHSEGSPSDRPAFSSSCHQIVAECIVSRRDPISHTPPPNRLKKIINARSSNATPTALVVVTP